MKKIKIFFALMIIFSTLLPRSVQGYTVPSTIRVGLESHYKEADNVPIGNETLAVGYETGGVFQTSAVIRRNSSFAAVSLNGAFVKMPGSYADYAQAKSAADAQSALGVNVVPALLEGGGWVLYTDAQNAAGAHLADQGRRVALTDGGRIVAVFENENRFAQFRDGAQGFVLLGDRKYRGTVELSRYNGRKITPVNVVSLDEYLYSVVPSEMHSTWHIESLKAQAVACRTYMVTRMGVHREQGYDVCDLGHCQNYRGAGNEATSASQAVDQTSGLMIYYGGQPINAVYFSSSGGVTEDSENVWANTVPYLRSVVEIGEYDPKQWTRSFSMQEITGLLAQNNIDIGTATKVSIEGVSTSGRVTALSVTGTAGATTLYKEEIRNFFSSATSDALQSRNFRTVDGTGSGGSENLFVVTGSASSPLSLAGAFGVGAGGAVNRLSDACVVAGRNGSASYGAGQGVSSSGSTVTFTGSGWGHGVGMSQHGAEGMAQRGYSFKQILEYYYTGAVVQS